MSNPVVPESFAAPAWWRLIFMACMCSLLFSGAAWSAGPPPAGKQILFVEDTITDYREFLTETMEVVVLDGRQDGLRQIAQALQGRRGITGLHLISHGGPGALHLGSARLDLGQLSARATELHTIRAALHQNADILLYGCNVAEGISGQRFIGQLARATGARVAASTNATGAAAQGGNWILEQSTGSVRTAALSYPDYNGILPAGTVLKAAAPNWTDYGPTFNDNEGDNGDIPGIVYEMFFADSSGVATGTVAAYNNGLGTVGTVLIADTGTGNQNNQASNSFVIKSQAGKFKLTSFLIQDYYDLKPVFTATPYLNGAPVGASWTFTIPINSGYASTINLPGQFANVTEIRITSDGGTSPQPGAKNIWQGFNNFVFADPILNTNANLSALSLSSGALNPGFTSANTTYDATVANATASITVTPTVADTARATVTVNGVSVASGAASGAIALNVGSNIITTIVTAEDGTTTRTTTTTVTRLTASSNANLSALALSQGTLAPGFGSATTTYTASVPFTTTSLTVTPTRADANASITVNGVAVTSGSPSGAIGLAVGDNVIATVVTAQDGSTTKTYTTTVTRAAASGNNQLSALSLSSGTLVPGFASGTTGYTADVSNATTSLTVTPTVADSTASVTVNGVATPSGNASGAIALNLGSNTITVTATAQNGTPRSYTITVTRAASSNADLAALSLGSGTLAPAFASGTASYTADVTNFITNVTVTPTLADATASVTVNGSPTTSGNASAPVPLAVGANTITVLVTAQNGTTTKTYTVIVTRAASANNNLSALSLSNGTLNPVFNPATLGYTASISFATTSITVTPTVANGTASVTVNGVAVTSGTASGAIAMNQGINTVTVRVTAQNGTTRDYTVTITRNAPSTNSALSALSLSSGTLVSAFASGTTSYTAGVSNATASLTITPTVQDASASVTVNGVATTSGNASGAIGLAVGANTITTVVTAQDGTTTTSYTVTVNRAASSNANLSALALSGGSISPVFNPATTGYTLPIVSSTASITVTPAVAEPNATVKVNGVAVASGNASGAIAMNTGANTVTVEVTAQNSATKTYTITVTRAISTNNDLASLSLSNGTLNPGFSSAQQNYSANVGFATASLTVTPTVADSSASVTVNGVAVTSGTASGAIALNTGANTITVTVTAQDGSPRSYMLTVTRAVSTNADLSALALSGGTLTPVFAAGTNAYTANVGNASATLTVTPTAAGPAAIKVNGIATASGAASGAIPLNVGSNTITVGVTAQDGVTVNTYTVTVTRAPSPIAELNGLSLSVGTLSPVFTAGTTAYTASVGNATSTLSLTPSSATGSISVNGAPVGGGSTSSPINLNAGPNVISVIVTAPDGVTTRAYTVTVTREGSGNAELSALMPSSGSLAFAPSTFAYTLTVPHATSTLSVTPTLADSSATIAVNGVALSNGVASPALALAVGSGNLITVVVTAQNGVSKTYTVSVTRAGSANAALASLALSGGTLSPGFASSVTSYALDVANGTTSLTVTPAVADSTASVTVNGAAVASGSASAAIPLALGSNSIGIVVKAQDGSTATTTITVTRAQAPATASLAGQVYTDANHDGVRDSAEQGVAAVTVKLSGVDLDGGKVDLSAVSGADGSFSFGTLKAGTYTLTELQPAGTLDGKETAGSQGGTVDNGAFDDQSTHNQIGSIVLAPGQQATGYLFGEQLSGVLQGFVYVDTNGNGTRDSGEAPLSGVRLNLTGGSSAAATSGADGSFSFAGILPGTYALSRNPADSNGAQYADGRERAGAAGGSINNSSFGTQAHQVSIVGSPGTELEFAL